MNRQLTGSGAGRDCWSRRVVRGPFASTDAGQAGLSHQVSDPLAVDADSRLHELGVDTRRTVRAPAALVDLPHLQQQTAVQSGVFVEHPGGNAA